MTDQTSAPQADGGDAGPARELLTRIVRPSMFWVPDRQAPSGWIEHVPFAFWLVDVVRPRTIVELGTQHGVSYSALCQAVKSLALGTACFAVDTWSGDAHAGHYPDSVYGDFAAFNDQHYRAFSRLVRSSFDDALTHFEDRSIDLLHIDGFHTYEAVRHDFESWLPKLSANAIVLFHDTNVRDNNFGVFRFWPEVSRDRPHFNFLHAHGLGVLGMGDAHPPALRLLLEPMPTRDLNAVREMFAALGGALRLSSERAALERSLAEREAAVAALGDEAKRQQDRVRALERMLVERRSAIKRATIPSYASTKCGRFTRSLSSLAFRAAAPRWTTAIPPKNSSNAPELSHSRHHFRPLSPSRAAQRAQSAAAGLKGCSMKTYVTVGLTVLAGAALLETALIPGILIGGVAVLAPRYLPKGALPGLRRRVETLAGRTVQRPGAAEASRPHEPHAGVPQGVLPKFAIGQAVAKTITFRIIVTVLDFSTNYLVIGEVATAAGLSTFNLIAGPLFYLTHEAAWNYLGPADDAIELPALTAGGDTADAERRGERGFTVSRALAKTVTFRVIASTMDFATNYFVVRDVGSALILSASGFILGPFVYYGHEKAWDYFTAPKGGADLPAAPLLLPAPR